MPTVLVVDDDRHIHLLIKTALEPIAQIVSVESAEAALRKVNEGGVDTVLLDIGLPDQSGLAAFCDIQAVDRRLPVIFMTSEAASHTAIGAMQLGAFDYLAKPLAVDSLRELISRALQQREIASVPVAIHAEDPGESTGEGELFIGRSKPMLDVFKAIGRVSKQTIPVLIRGESGTGKELVARALFQYSHRAEGPFLAVNCAALPDNLLESELFGHEKGSFTGADSRRIGKFEQCSGGTLFLDEIGDMAPGVQAKVLRVLQDQRFERVGGNKELTTDVRIVAATNRPLEDMVKSGDFREDLLYRLNGVTIELPPLKTRPDDIKLLIKYFLAKAKKDLDRPLLDGLSPEALQAMIAYDWPGNVRQLRSVVRRCVLDTVMPVISPDVLPADIRRSAGQIVETDRYESSDGSSPGAGPSAREGSGLPELVDRLLDEKSTQLYAATMEFMERYVLMRVLSVTGGNQSQAAEILGITRGKLRDRINTYGITLENEVSIKSQP